MTLNTESKLRKQLRTYLKSIDAYAFFPVNTGRGKRTVDILFCYHGMFFAVEVKDIGLTPTPMQDHTLKEVADSGGASFWCDSWTSFHDKFNSILAARGILIVPTKPLKSIGKVRNPIIPATKRYDRNTG